MNMCMVAATVNILVGCNSGSPDLEAYHVMRCDAETGAAEITSTKSGPQGTIYFAHAPDGRTVYTSVRRGEPAERRSALVAIPVEGGALGEPRTVAELPCETPCHVALSPDGSRLGFAAYVSATAGTVRLADGSVASIVHRDDLKGPNARRQDKAHAHCAFFTPDGSRLGIVDLGLDRIFFYDPATMKRDDAMTIVVAPGLGPRHAIFSKDGRFLFVIHELGNAVSSYSFDACARRFAHVGTASTLPDGWQGETKAAAIKLTDDGRLLMASNRGHDSIAFFDVDAETGRLSRRGIAPLAGKFPRDFMLLPGERLMVVGHKMSNEIAIYRFDRAKCSLTPAGKPVPAWRPLYFGAL